MMREVVRGGGRGVAVGNESVGFEQVFELDMGGLQMSRVVMVLGHHTCHRPW